MSVIQVINDHLQKLFNDDNYPEALTYLEELKNNEELTSDVFAKVNYHIGRIKYYQNEIDSAKYSFLKALEHSPNDIYSIIFLSKVLEKKGKNNSSIKLLGKAYEENKNYNHLPFTINSLLKNVEEDDDEIKDFNSTHHHSYNKKVADKNPKISIIVLCYNKLEYTERCLKSIFKNTSYSNFEVIVVDNASVDDTPGFLESFGNQIKFVRSSSNLGFVGGNNLAAQYSDGEFVLFLNNDTEVQLNWLNHLYQTFVIHPNAGVAGSKLIYPDNTLQEAGGIIFNDASGWNYGKGGKVNDARYNFVREVDYCSGAAIMVRKKLFDQLNGFDERYSPAYYEDTDLCFGIRKLGYKVYYCPFSKVTHFEGATSGTDVNSGFKRYQIINSEKFKKKWSKELSRQYPNDPSLVYQFSNRNKGKRVLIIDDMPPLPDRASGALRHYNTVDQMLKLGYQVTYVHMTGKDFTDEKAQQHIYDFKMRGVEFNWFNYEGWWSIRNEPAIKDVLKELIDSLDLRMRKYNMVYIAFWHIAAYFIDLIREQIPRTPIVIDSVDIHYLREMRRAKALNDVKLLREAQKTKINELALYKKSDCILTVTEKDRDVLIQDLSDKSVIVIPDVHDGCDSIRSFNERKDFLFVGNFNHNPNEDGVFFFIEKIFPLIKKEIPHAKFYVVGNHPTEKLLKLSSKEVIVTGWVPEIKPYLEKCLVSVVPLRFGAGMKGKVGQSLSHGLPMVSTVIGAEGMGIINGEHSYVTDDPVKFAEYAIKLYTDEKLWNDFSEKGKKLITSQFSSELMRKRLENIMSFETRNHFSSKRGLENPDLPVVSIILITFNQWNYTKKCLDSIRKYSKVHYEIIVVDNNSADKTIKNIEKNYPEIRLIKNVYNLGFPKAANQGLTAAYGEYVLLLNNDTEVTNGWLERMVEIAESNHKFGIIGPMSNAVSGVQIDKDAKYNSINEMRIYAKTVSTKNSGIVEEFPRVAFLCTLIKKELIDKIGGLDERFSPGNFEDDDFCLRAQLAGYKTIIAKDVFIHHYGSVSFKQNGENKYAERLQINEKIFIEKWGSNPEGIWLKGEKWNKRSNVYPIEADLFNQSVARAFVNIDDEEYNIALENLNLALKYFTDSSRVGYESISSEDLLNIAANLALNQNKLEDAKSFFEEQLEENPNSSQACFGLGEIFIKADMFEEAKTMFEWAVVNDDQNQNAEIRLKGVNQKLNLPENHFFLAEEKLVVEEE
jgi:GT2 family glycosyltransferase/glycosyltransferase involved in cell wall biosynthesis